MSKPHSYYDPYDEKAPTGNTYPVELKELMLAMEEAEAGDQPGPKRMAKAIRMLWGMIFRAEETSVYWMKEADKVK